MLKSIAHVIKHVNFQFYRNNLAGVIWKNQQLAIKTSVSNLHNNVLREQKDIGSVIFDKFDFSHFKQVLQQIPFFKICRGSHLHERTRSRLLVLMLSWNIVKILFSFKKWVHETEENKKLPVRNFQIRIKKIKYIFFNINI